jgi:dihydrofolate reductase
VGKLRFTITMSLDGYVAGPDQSLDNPLGVGGESLHDWAIATQAWRERHGMEDGETGLDNDRISASAENLGATIMGRNMFGPPRGGPWGDDPWRGWWGDEPPFGTPVFVLTHHEREPLELGDTTFHFVTEGIEPALERAFAGADARDVALAGGASVAQQYLRARLIDEMEIHVVPLLLGDGSRLFENLDGGTPGYECVELLSSPAVAHYRYVRTG